MISSARRTGWALVISWVALAAVAAHAQPGPKLTSAVVRGSSVYTQSELFALYRDQLGKPISRDSARAIVTGIAARYEQDGFPRPQIRLDDYLIAAGVLRIDIVEVRIAGIEIVGDPGPYRETLEALGRTLESEQAIKRSELQAAMQRMRELRGLTLSATTARDRDDADSYRLGLDTDFDRIGGAVRLSNRGTDEIGPTFVFGRVLTHGLFSGRAHLGVLFGAATDYDEYHGLGLSGDVAVGRGGARMLATAFRSRSDPREAGVDLDDRYLRDRLTLGMQRPLIRSGRGELTLAADLELDDLAIRRSGRLLRDERLRILEARVRRVARAGPDGQYAYSFDAAKGLGGLGSRLDALDLADDRRRRDFAVLRASVTHVRRLGASWTSRLDAFAQHSTDVLPYTQRFKIGGDRLGRGFEVAEIAGDSGVGGKAELRRHLRGLPAVLAQVSVYAFYDVGAAWKNDVPGRESAATGGFGFGTRGERTSAYIELAQPLNGPDIEGNDDVSVFVEFNLRL